ncbi:hypothetical protein J2848_003028 [Azospirillum lipoferum]|nr:hypothetical protein [Azospirillum sp. NL1]MCP1611355.1 hypothetical protein [Azospirillum lipoferum]
MLCELVTASDFRPAPQIAWKGVHLHGVNEDLLKGVDAGTEPDTMLLVKLSPKEPATQTTGYTRNQEAIGFWYKNAQFSFQEMPTTPLQPRDVRQGFLDLLSEISASLAKAPDLNSVRKDQAEVAFDARRNLLEIVEGTAAAGSVIPDSLMADLHAAVARMENGEPKDMEDWAGKLALDLSRFKD